jgi:hypothetical protein
MSNLRVDRNKKYMQEMWGTTRLITDYDSFGKNDKDVDKSKFIQEIMDYESNHDLKRQTELHEKIRNDVDYDDWEYGTEPAYGKKW